MDTAPETPKGSSALAPTTSKPTRESLMMGFVTSCSRNMSDQSLNMPALRSSFLKKSGLTPESLLPMSTEDSKPRLRKFVKIWEWLIALYRLAQSKKWQQGVEMRAKRECWKPPSSMFLRKITTQQTPFGVISWESWPGLKK